MISKISSRVGANRIFVIRSNGGGNPTPTSTPVPTSTPTPTFTPTATATPTPTSTSTPTPTPTILIPENDLVYLLIPNDDLTYTLIPTNDLTHTFIPNNDLLFTLVPDGELTYVLLPDNDLNPVEIPINDVNYTLIPNTDLSYTLIPNNDIEYSIIRNENINQSWWSSVNKSQLLAIYPDYLEDYEGVIDEGMISNWYAPGIYTGLGKRLITSGEKLMFSLIIDTDLESSDPNYLIGFGNVDTDFENPLGSNQNSIGFNNLGELYYDGQMISYGYPTFGNIGDIIDVLIDCGNEFYYRVNNGVWISPGVNPLTGGGIAYSEVDIYPAISLAGFEGPSVVKVLNYVYYSIPNGFEYIYNTTINEVTPTPTPTPTPTELPIDENGYRFYKWEITDTKTTDYYTQSSEFVFMVNGTNQVMSGTSISNPDAFNLTDATEGAIRIIDGNLNTKWLDSINQSYGGKATLIFDFGEQKIFTGYKWATGNDYEERDPKNWRVFGSNDEVNYTTLSIVNGYNSTSERNTFNGEIDFDYVFTPHTPTPTPTATSTPTPTATETPTPTPTPTPVSHPYEYQIIDRTDVTGQFGSDLSLACQALDCLSNSTCMIGGSSNGYFNNETPQIGDSSYNGTTSTIITGLVDGYYIINLVGQYMLVEFVSNQIDSVPSCPTPTPTSTPTPTPTNTPTPTPEMSTLNIDLAYGIENISFGGITYTSDTTISVIKNQAYTAICGSQFFFTFDGTGVAPLVSTASNISVTVTGSTATLSVVSTLPEPTPTPTSTPTPTATETPTPTPTPTPTEEPSGLIVTISEVGSDVIMSGSGSLNLTGLIEGSVQSGWGINAMLGTWVIGPSASFFGRKYQGNAFSTYPTSFGSGYTAPTSFTGDAFGIQNGSLGKDIIVPIGYTSGSPLSGTVTFANKTISSMGLTPGTYLYDWGNDSITLQIGS
jgi:hypothetical protein